jgi:hypothetical protein
LFTFSSLLCGVLKIAQEESMKFKFALVGLAALGSLTAAGTASAIAARPTFSNFER